MLVIPAPTEQIPYGNLVPLELSNDIAIGGATLAAEAADLGLIDEYRTMVYPVLVGGGIPFFPQRERRVDLELVETRTFSSRVVYSATAWRASRLVRRALGRTGQPVA